MTIRSTAGLLALSTGAVLLGLVWGHSKSQPSPLGLSLHPAELLADGHDTATLVIEASTGPPRISLPENAHSAVVQEVRETGQGWQAQIRAGVLPGRVAVRVEAPGFLPAVAELTLHPETGDRAGDGTPDLLRLDDEHDRQAFRRWFTFLAEAQYFQDPAARPAEIDDCAALLRYAYREALRPHDSVWAAAARLPLLPGLEAVDKYQYPYSPLGAALFRVRPGPFHPSDPSTGAFAQFADAQTLQRYNMRFRSRDLAQAAPGDVLFFRRDREEMPFHSMIYLGSSHIRKDGLRYVLYHTGPDASGPGELRRPSVDEIRRHPDPQWRPLPGNPSFLGIYRWNILR